MQALDQTSASPIGATRNLGELRQQEFARLDENQQVYFDYTGAALYPISLVDHHADRLRKLVLGNPHSYNPAALAATQNVDDVRRQVLNSFNASSKDYCVIFTANATAAVKLVAESFPFQSGSQLLLTTDNHNSINGIREYAWAKGAQIHYVQADMDLGLSHLQSFLADSKPVSWPSIFAYPAQSNFSGIKHSLRYIDQAQQLGYNVVLDAAAFAPSNRLDLSQYKPDFVCLSFYKMFGYPTGVGALIARKDALKTLSRPWFAGGVVDFASTQYPIHQLSQDEAGFEDGTVNFTTLLAVSRGLSFLQELSMDAIGQHLQSLGDAILSGMGELQHNNGQPLVKLYGGSLLEYGSCRAFNLLDPQGYMIDYELVEQQAGLHGISIRGGCFCNPGCAEAALELSPEKMEACLESLRDDFSHQKLARCLGQVSVGALRVSWGIANNQSDVEKLIRFLKTFLS